MSSGVRSTKQLRSTHITKQGDQPAQGTLPEKPPEQRQAHTSPPSVGIEGDRFDDQLVPAAQRFDSRQAASDSAWSTSFRRPFGRGPRRKFFTVASWAFCLIGITTVVLHVLLLLLPLMKITTTLASTVKQSLIASTTALSTLSTEPLLSSSRTTLRISTSSTTTHLNCTKRSPDVPGSNDLTGVFHWSHSQYPHGPAGGPQPVYCIYNVTRFRRPAYYGFLPLDIPLSLCPGVVYWSWRLAGAKLTSRAKKFDETYGLAAIQNVSRDQGVDVAVILTLGGYPEDSADFHKLERNLAVRQRLIQEGYIAYQKYSLAGINLHWVRDEDICEEGFGSSAPHLAEFVRSLRTLIAINTDNTAFIVSAMVDPEDPFQMDFFRALRSDLNLTFFTTHRLAPVTSFDEYCKNSVHTLELQLDAIKPLFPPPPLPRKVPATNTGQYKGLCITMSLALHNRHGYRLEQPAPPRPASAKPGYIALFEVCDTKLSFEEWRIPVPGCTVKKSRGILLNVTFAVEHIKVLREKMDMMGNPDKQCVLLYDVDFDNYMTGCSGHAERYLMLQHFYSARGRYTKFYLTDYLP